MEILQKNEKYGNSVFLFADRFWDSNTMLSTTPCNGPTTRRSVSADAQ